MSIDDPETPGMYEQRVPSELVRMARIMTTKDGVREITDGDRGVISRTDDLAQLAEFSRQLLTRFTERRFPRYGLTVIALLVLAATAIATLVLDGPKAVLVLAMVLFVPAYILNLRVSRAEKLRRQIFEAWFAAIKLRLEQIDRGELHGERGGTAVYELAGLPAPVFVGTGLRVMTEADRVAIGASVDIDALLAFEHQLRSRRDTLGKAPWLTEVGARLLALAASN